MRTKRTFRFAAVLMMLLVAVSLVFAACGKNDDGTDATAPVVTVNEKAAELTLADGEASYTLDYTVSPTDATVTISCDKENGFTREGNDVTFTAADTYVFTVTAKNDAGEGSGTITVTVKAEGTQTPSEGEAPVIAVSEKTAEVVLENGKAVYTLKYTVTPADANISVNCNTLSGASIGADKKTVTFTKAGNYTFNIAATSNGKTVKASVTVTVKEEESKPEFTTDQANISLELTEAQFPAKSSATLTYVLAGGGTELTLAEADDKSGWTFDAASNSITFDKAGTYSFTLTATNSKGSDTTAFTATVTDKFADVNRQDPFIDADFETATKTPDGWTDDVLANGKIEYTGEGAKFEVLANSEKNAITRTPFTVNEGQVEISVTFSNDYTRPSDSSYVPFLNLIVLESSGATNTWPVGVGVQDSYLVINEDNSWQSMSVAGADRVRLIDGEKYTVKAIVDFETERVYLYISGEKLHKDATRTETIDLGENVYIGNFDFRGNGNDPVRFRFGSDAVDTAATLYKVTACKLGAEAPTVTVNEAAANVTLLGGKATYELDYSVTPEEAQVTVSCNKNTATVDEDKHTVTFSAAGEYTFTIKAVNDGVTVEKTITVTVLAEGVVAPEITVSEAEKTVPLKGETAEYKLQYTVTPAEAQVMVSCDKTTGAVVGSDNKTVTFSAAGVYTFTIKAVNDEVPVEKTIVVTVEAKPSFTTAPKDGALTLQSVQWDYANDSASRPGYTVEYVLSGADSAVLTETTAIGGWWYNEDNNVIYFTKGGTYQFKLTAENSAGTADATFEVTVTDLYAEGNWSESVIWNQQFNTTSKPDGWTYVNDGSGVAWTEDGASFACGGSDNEFVDYTFDSAMTGLVEFKVDFTISEDVWADKDAGKYNSYWANIFFINDGNKNTISVAIVDNQIWVTQGNDAGGWGDFSAFESQKMRVVPGERYTLRAVLDTDTKRMYLYIIGQNRIADGEGDNPGDTVEFPGYAYLGNFDFRDNSGTLATYRMGSNNGAAYFTMHGIVAKQLTEKTVEGAPVVTVKEDSATRTLTEGTASYELKYTVDPADAQVSVTCEPNTGVEISENKNVTFTAVGTYTFTITASKDDQTSTPQTIKVVVNEAPKFTTAPEDAFDMTLQDFVVDTTDDNSCIASRANVTIAYEVTATPAANITLEETSGKVGWSFDEASKKIYFSKGGEYSFKITAENDAGSASETFAVTVTDTYAKDVTADAAVMDSWTFGATADPDWKEEDLSGTGFRNWTENGLEMGRTENNGSAFVNHKFDKALDGVYEFSVEFTVDETTSNGTFANILFLVTGVNNGDKSVITVTVNEWMIKINESGKWRKPAIADNNGFAWIVENEKYTVRAVIDTETERLYLYLDGAKLYKDGTRTETFDLSGELYLGNFDFRDNGNDINYYRTGLNSGDPSKFTVHGITAKQLSPQVTAGEAEGRVQLEEGSASYTLRYTASDGAEVAISCDKDSGFELEGNNVTFKAADTYVFTVKAENDFGTATATITVIVDPETIAPPQFTTTQKDEEVTLQTTKWTSAGATTGRPHITLSYETQGAESVELTETTNIGGWTYDAEAGVIYFTRGGDYEFKLTAINIEEVIAEDTFAVEVTDLYAVSGTEDAPVIWQQQFNGTTKPEGWAETIGTAGTDTITYSGNGVTLHKDLAGKQAFLQYDFKEALVGVVEFTVKFKTTSTGFCNIFFLRGNSNKYAVTVAVQNNILIVREDDSNSGGWSNNINLFNNTKTRLVPGVDYTLRVVADINEERIYLYISGESLLADPADGGDATETAAMGDNLYLGNFDFRANGQPVLAYRMGSDIQEAETDFTVYSITAKSLSPTLTVTEKEKTLNDFTNAAGSTYTLQYQAGTFASPKAAVITCDKQEGWSNEGDTVTFTATGTYVFTVTVENKYGATSKEITVTVKKPTTGVTIDVDSDRDASVYAGGVYTLEYTAGSDVTQVELTCDKADGYEYDEKSGTILFTNPGVYEFTLTAKNADGSLSDTSEFKVTVTDEETVLWNPTLTSEVTGEDITNKADGADKRGTITFDENGMTVTSGSGIGDKSPLIMYKKFDSVLSGLVKTEVTFVDNKGTGFINLIFFQNSGITTNDGNEATMCFAVENRMLRHRGMVDGSLKGWTSFTIDGQTVKVKKGQEYTLTIYNDFDNEVTYFYITGTVELGESTKELNNYYLGSVNFRRQGKGDNVQYIYTGTSQKNVSYTIKSLTVEQSVAPQVFMNDSYSVQAGGTVSLTTVGAADGYFIECEQEGWSIKDNVLTFAQTGEYTVTVRAYSKFGVSETVTIKVNVAEASE